MPRVAARAAGTPVLKDELAPTEPADGEPISEGEVATHAAPPALPQRARGSAASGQSSVDTPVMRQYLEIKERYPDCILFFRLGDFYEMFFDDAVVVSQLLDLTLTARDKHRDVPVPMCGVPHHASRYYVAKLIGHGKKVAICDQVEDAKKAKKIVRRAVTQVITPGVILEEEQLEPKAGHYLAAYAPGSGLAGLAYLDVSTGEFAATELAGEEGLEELARIEPAELLVVTDAPGSEAVAQLVAQLERRLRIPVGQSRAASVAEDRLLVGELMGTETGERPSSVGGLLLSAAAACVRYAKATQPVTGIPVYKLRCYRPNDSLIIDESTKNNLELFATLMERKHKGSLLSVIDQTRTAMGGRLLRRYLLEPLRQLDGIRARHDAVEWLVERQSLRKALRDGLSEIRDLERLTGRLAAQVATPRDLSVMGQGLRSLPRLQALLREAAQAENVAVPALLELGEDLAEREAQRIDSAIEENPPVQLRDGGYIRRGYSAALDELISLSQGGKDQILRIEERERERTGISSLKVRYNRIFGYYIEITRSNLSRVPSDYVRKQTTATGERYVTSELAEYEAKVLGAEERRIELELELFAALLKELLPACVRLLQIAHRVAQLDVLSSLAELAHRSGYVRPAMNEGRRLIIEDGRHPVVEKVAERFVPNDTELDADSEDPKGAAQILVLTGPNMAGKSTVMRQVALIVILAQMGSFVPARRAEIGLVDRVMTRVGASDNLFRGESTFMVEMRETSQILKRATRRSLVILDEIGRGTSTYDGVSIAWAVAEHLHDHIGCRTMFATHYHELCALAEARPRVRNASVAVRHQQGDVVFLHRLVPGGASRSYGIDVAKLAGLPTKVIGRAREILSALEAGSQVEGSPVHGVPPVRTSQLPLFVVPGASGEPSGPQRARAEASAVSPPVSAEPVRSAREKKEDTVLGRLRAVSCDDLSPRQAFELLSELHNALRG